MSSAEISPTKLSMPKVDSGLEENYVFADPDFQERYINSFMATLERNYEHNPEHCPWFSIAFFCLNFVHAGFFNNSYRSGILMYTG